MPPYEADGRPHGTASAIDFGVKALGVRHVVVLGHSFCAGVRCLLEHDHGRQRFDYVTDWVGAVRGVREEMDGLVTEATHSSLLWVRDGEEARRLATYGGSLAGGCEGQPRFLGGASGRRAEVLEPPLGKKLPALSRFAGRL